MKIIVTESQLQNITKLMEQENKCQIQDIDVLNTFLDGVISLEDNTLGDEIEDVELMGQIKDPKNKEFFEKISSSFESMTVDQLKGELAKVLSVKNLQEQTVPYMEQTMSIGGIEVPKVIVHGLAAVLIISILSKLLKSLGSVFKSSGGSRNSRLRSKAVGCQGAGARARLTRKRRRRENWKSLMRKLGIK
jgi:hypothetical protein